MKKKNILLLTLICSTSLVILCGLLIYAFKLQNRQDEIDERNNPQTNDSIDDSENGNPEDRKEDPGSDKDLENSKDSAENDGADSESEVDSDSQNDDGNEDEEADAKHNFDEKEEPSDPIVLAFAGDINFNEESKPVARYDRENKGILGGLSKDLVEEMNAADIMMLNNEFAYSTRGTKTPNKSYTFRANPSRVNILHEMGVDIVSLANNHALDYGPDALMDTFDTLEEAGIDYVGAGKNLARAEAPISYTVGSKKIAFLASSKVIFAMDWYASENSPGMVGTYDPAPLVKAIKKASADNDYVVVFVHWGVERNDYPEKYQRDFAKKYIDAGADIVVGCHPHVMQGFEFYKGKPIAYSLGNFWFNSSHRETGLLKIYIDPEGTLRTQILPAMGKNTYTYLLTEKDERKAYFDYMEKISFDVTIDKDGFITPKE
ncbi:MAG: CapA family protein [Lachnospiraceae bacterium]|jgi:poly-gamma-glutamate synthesis protein (capsule biosynthesis protein)|nr:CapA family protein [Lachnospiraceae bacterium]